MSEQLLVRLGSDQQESVFWIVWSETEKEIIASGELPDASALATLKERAGQRPVVTLVPSRDVSLKQVTLPPRAARKAISAIPYMLEDELSEDIDSLFFALGSRHANRQNVAVVRREQMQLWQSMLDDAGLFSTTMIPDALAMPYHEDGSSVMQLGDSLLVREDQWKVLEGEAGWIISALRFAAKKQPEPLPLYTYSPLEQLATADFTVQSQQLDAPLEILATHYKQADINLLQGEFKQQKQQTQGLGKWRLAASLAIIALILTLGDKGVTLYQLERQQIALETSIAEQFRQVFPNTRRIGDVRQIRSRINNEIARLEQGGGDTSLLVMLTRLADAFNQSQVVPQLLRFDAQRGELRIQASGRNFAALEQFKNAATAAGFNVDQGAINNRNNSVVSAMTIRS